MRAVVISGSLRLSRAHESGWGALAPLVDRPFLHHVVECVVDQGIREVDFILGPADQLTRNALGDGTRWGARFGYYSLAGSVNVYDAIQQIPLEKADEVFLLAHSDRLPMLCLEAAVPATTLFCWKEGAVRWTGWGVVRAADALRVPKGIDELGLFSFFLKAAGEVVCTEGRRPLTAQSYNDLIEANRRVLSREFPGLLFGGREVQPGVWMARNASVHPTARFAPPAFLGENCRIGALVLIGPAASIGNDCVIERETHVADSVVYGGSYVGQQLVLKGVVVDRSRLISTKWDAEIEDVDELLLGSVFGASLLARLRGVCVRVAAVAALVFFAPCFAAIFLGSAFGFVPALKKRSIVRTPTVSESYRWRTFSLWSFGDAIKTDGRDGWGRHFFLGFLPALPALAAGYLALSGPRPRTSDEVEDLPAVQRWVYVRSRSGILQPNSSQSGETDADLAVESAGTEWRAGVAAVTNYAGRVFLDCLRGLSPFSRRRKTE